MRYREQGDSDIYSIVEDSVIYNLGNVRFKGDLEFALAMDYIKDSIDTKNGKTTSRVDINTTFLPEITTHPKNKDTVKVLDYALDDYYQTAIDGLWEKRDRFARELEQLNINKKSDLDRDTVIEIASMIDEDDPNNVIFTEFVMSAPYEFRTYYAIKFDTLIRTFKGTNSVDLIINMYIVDENDNILVDSYEPSIFGFSQKIVDKGEVDLYVETMLDELTSQF